MKKGSIKFTLIALLLAVAMMLSGCDFIDELLSSMLGGYEAPISLSEIPEFSGEPFVVINGGVPFFEESELTTESYEHYSELDELGRCQVAMACIGIDIMPTEVRGDIQNIKPTGWHSVQYDCVSGKNLYNRCHLIGYQLTGENDNEKNLITGTRYMNWDGMYDFETMVADYIEDTENHVMYRVTPIFDGYDLVARGVLMEAYSVEDNGGLQFNVYCYNNQPGVVINYFDGTSYLNGETPPPAVEEDEGGSEDSGVNGDVTYILNVNTKKFHKTSCASAASTKPQNKADTTKTREQLVSEGYSACGICKP